MLACPQSDGKHIIAGIKTTTKDEILAFKVVDLEFKICVVVKHVAINILQLQHPIVQEASSVCAFS